MNKNLRVYKSNDIVESGYQLSLNEQRVLLACIAQIDATKPSVGNAFKLNAKDFATVFEVSEDRAYSELDKVSDLLAARWVYILNPQIDVSMRKIRWVSSIDYGLEGTSELTLKFSPEITPYLFELKEKYTSYSLGNVCGMTSIYGVRLYELLTQHKQFEKRKFELSELKEILGVAPDTYSDIRNFKARVITPAVKNVNQYSDLKITEVTYQKKGRAISDVCFFFEPAKKKAVVVKKEKVIVEKPAESVADVIYNENVKRFGKEIADKTKADSEVVTPKQVAEQLAAFMRHTKVN
jgi:plasmid replication initiation protein